MPTLALAALLLAQLSPFPLTDGGPLGLDDLGVAPDGRFVVPQGDSVLLLAADGGRTVLRPPPSSKPRRISSALVTARGAVIAADRNGPAVLIWTGDQLQSSPLAAGPDYVRATDAEIWVTEPDKHQLEVFAREPSLKALSVVAVPGEPESLVLDAARDSAWTLTEDSGHLLQYQLSTRKLTHDWKLACAGSPKGLVIAADQAFVGCSGGVALAISLADGKELGRLAVGQGVDIIAFDPVRRRLYLPAGKSATLTVAEVDARGALRKLRELPSVERGHCVAFSSGLALVCDPKAGRVLELDDRGTSEP